MLNRHEWTTAKSSDGLQCLAAMFDGEKVHLMNDKQGVQVTATREEWEAFLGGVKEGEFDLP